MHNLSNTILNCLCLLPANYLTRHENEPIAAAATVDVTLSVPLTTKESEHLIVNKSDNYQQQYEDNGVEEIGLSKQSQQPNKTSPPPPTPPPVKMSSKTHAVNRTDHCNHKRLNRFL